MSEESKRRLLAEALLEEAEHSSDAAIRSSLSRAYYALHHLGIEITGKSGHTSVRDALAEQDNDIAEEYRYFLNLRSQADYDPGFVQKKYGVLQADRFEYLQDMQRARRLFERLKGKLSG